MSVSTEVRVQRSVAAQAEARRTVGRRPSRFWRIREDLPSGWRLPLMATSLLAPLLLWTLLSATGAVNQVLLPTPLDVLAGARTLLSSGVLASDASASLQRVFIGFGIAILISVPLGLAMGTFKSIEALFEPAIGFFRYMPAPAFIPLFILWLGLEEAPKIALIVVGTVFFNTLMTANLVWQVPGEMIRAAYTLGAGTFTVFRRVIFPHAVPGMIDAIRVNLAAAWQLVIVAELIAAQEGLGYRIVLSQRAIATDRIFALLIVIGVIGIATDIALRQLRNRAAPWSQE